MFEYLFRSFLPLHDPMGFGASDFVEFAVAAPLLARSWTEPLLRRLAARPGWAMLVLAALPVALRLAPLPLHPVPTPSGADDLSYILLGDTLAHFRLANPPPGGRTIRPLQPPRPTAPLPTSSRAPPSACS